jgi:hypothetical protein
MSAKTQRQFAWLIKPRVQEVVSAGAKKKARETPGLCKDVQQYYGRV